MASHSHAQPVGGPLNKRFVTFMAIFLGVWAVVLLFRFIYGIGVVSGLTDYYPWGVWIAFDVVTGTALACGGYAIAILCYILNKGHYHPLVRPALLTSALGYSMAALAIILDVGRWWHIWRIPIGGFPDSFRYNWDSALLEVALCVMAYVGVLWIELGPAFLEKWKATSKSSALVGFATAGLKFYDKALIWIIALGVLLPTMHQSSLGTLMLLAGHKLHGLWFTPWIPLLFLISCVGMGYSVVVWESSLSSNLFKREKETSMLISLSGAMVVVVSLYLVLRLGDLIISGKTGLMFTSGWLSLVFWGEIALFAIALLILASKQRRSNFSNMLRASILLMLAGSMYRFNTYITAFQPAPGQSYFPSFLEVFITFGVIALEISLYYFIVTRYPILSGAPAEASAR
ncbi:MAG: Ni/Fe-hydrogenase cytochrome b subunit [Thermoanaerobaculales bacterium]|jgi:Ni/Fe-hydrogenase subunit HybB-like protein|nr:Ni/Fe-hydrogenase cytochrome b subunit [Thermoanaerobaculales bacterium]